MKNSFIIGNLKTSIGEIPLISATLDYIDYLGAIKVRWGIKRNSYKIEPGLYAVGNPDDKSDVFVTANYKLSFDALRKYLTGINGWILVLDTKGINVWCAAGKGTFGTNELINRIKVIQLDKIISHRKLILPQLGAVGIAAHIVKQNTGFTVLYGPIKASDIKSFIENNYRTDRNMRTVKFTFYDRAKLVPVEFMNSKKHLLIALFITLILAGLNSNGVSIALIKQNNLSYLLNTFSAYFAGTVLTPLFLPYIPFRSFSIKGFVVGLFVSLLLMIWKSLGSNVFEITSWILLISSISSYLAMNFTGASTFTSLSGVKKEMKFSVPLQISIGSISIVCLLIQKFI